MFRITNQWLAKCKLSQLEELDRASWDQLVLRLETDMSRPQPGIHPDNIAMEFNSMPSAAFAIGQVHKCSAYEVSSQYARFCLQNGKRNRKRRDHVQLSQQVAEGSNDNRLNEVRQISDFIEHAWWTGDLWHILTLSRRIYVYHDLLLIREIDRHGYKGHLAEACLGSAKKQNNLTPRLVQREELSDQLHEAIYEALHGFGSSDPVLTLLRDLNEKCNKIGPRHDQPDDLNTVSNALVELLLDWRLSVPRTTFPALCDAFGRMRDALKSKSAAAALHLPIAAYELWGWLIVSPEESEVRKSALLQWIGSLAPDFPKLEISPDAVLGAIAVSPIQRLPSSILPLKAKKPDMEAEALDRERLRDELLTILGQGSQQFRVAVSLIRGDTFNEVRDDAEVWKSEFAEIPDSTWSAVENRLIEWAGWTKQLPEFHKNPRYDHWIDEEIPAELHRFLPLNMSIEDWAHSQISFEPDDRWSLLEPFRQRLLRWALFSVVQDDIIAAVAMIYRQRKDTQLESQMNQNALVDQKDSHEHQCSNCRPI